ncbi:Hsp70 family protein [Methanobrevibacter sp.]
MDFNKTKHLIEEFFNGKLEVRKFLGEGAFANVYLVNHNYLDTLMALKIIKEPLKLSTNKKKVFREVTLACQLRHENIINIFDAAEISNLSEGNNAYFLMEYVSGGDLEQFLNSFMENNMFMPIERSLNLIRQILRGLNILHSANPPIIHHDLKPNNILLSFDDDGHIQIKISDFGFAKEITTGISDFDIAGARPYMAPELFTKTLSLESDVYAIGVIFYQLLTNRYPYDIDKYTLEELFNLKPWEKDLKPPSHYNENVFKELDQIVLKCLEFKAKNRYDDAGSVLVEVEKAIDKFKSSQILSQNNLYDEYNDDYKGVIVNDSLIKAFDLAKCENNLDEAIEILEREILKDYDVRRWYGETLRMWKSKHPDLKLVSKAFTIILKGRNYRIACNLLKEAIAYNPSFKNRYSHYIGLWEILTDLGKHKNLYKAVIYLESLMETNEEIKRTYENILPLLKTYSIDEIVVGAIRLINLNNFQDASNLLEFAVVCDGHVRRKYEYRLSLWKQNMKMHFKPTPEIKKDTVDFAIDLGTTDSVVSYFNQRNPIVIKNHKTGSVFTPSAVLIDDEGEIEVGSTAKEAILEKNHNAVSEFKNNMGFSLPFKFKNSSRSLLPEELSAEVLKDLRVSVYEQMGVNMEHAIVCVPANSNPLKIRAINDACEIAGLRSHNFILEPIAVSLAYNLRKNNAFWMIYDMGGATFNVTLIHDNNGEIEMFASAGLENFGGDSFDWKIVDDLFKPKISHDLKLNDFTQSNSKYAKVFAVLKNAAEKAKKDLTNSNSTDICISNLFDGYDFNYNLNRESLEEIIKPLIKHTFKLSRNLLKENSLTDENIEKIILAGGSSLSPVIRENMQNEFNIEIESGMNPLTVVAKGASVYAGSIEKPQTEIKELKFSTTLNIERGLIKGKVFADDSKHSFLGHYIEFKNQNHSTRIPLKIDGTFKFEPRALQYKINLYKNDTRLSMDEKSPNAIDGGKIHIPYMDDDFHLEDGLDFDRLMQKYSKTLKEIDYLTQYSKFNEHVIQNYIEELFQLSQSDETPFNLINIYINYLNERISKIKKEMEYCLLLENVTKKIDVINDNDLFPIESIDDIVDARDLEKLKDYHANLIEKYVFLNKERVIEECFFNLKFEGIYAKNQKRADDLIEKAHGYLNRHDYINLFNIINHLYELDER